jgi:hypothetical protein
VLISAPRLRTLEPEQPLGIYWPASDSLVNEAI